MCLSLCLCTVLAAALGHGINMMAKAQSINLWHQVANNEHVTNAAAETAASGAAAMARILTAQAWSALSDELANLRLQTMAQQW